MIQVGFKHEGDQMKKLNATAHAASMFMQLRRDSIKQDPVCPRCSPHLCSSACDWAKEEGNNPHLTHIHGSDSHGWEIRHKL
jgi:hypothetical protein